MRRAYLLWTVAAAGFAVDQVTKAIAAVVVEGHEPRHALGGTVTFTAFRNSGAAGSFAPRATLLFTLVAVVALVAIARVAGSVRSTGWAVGLGLIFAGAGGNLADRVFRTPGSAGEPCWTSSRSAIPGSSTSPISASRPAP